MSDDRFEIVLPEGAVLIAAFVPPDLSWEDWETIGHRICGAAPSPWAIGDWILQAPKTAGKLPTAARISGLAIGTCSTYRWVASKIAPGDRHPGLGFRFHQAVAGLEPAEQRHYLAMAFSENLSWPRLEARMALDREASR